MEAGVEPCVQCGAPGSREERAPPANDGVDTCVVEHRPLRDENRRAVHEFLEGATEVAHTDGVAIAVEPTVHVQQLTAQVVGAVDVRQQLIGGMQAVAKQRWKIVRAHEANRKAAAGPMAKCLDAKGQVGGHHIRTGPHKPGVRLAALIDARPVSLVCGWNFFDRRVGTRRSRALGEHCACCVAQM
eukprot:6943646-Prymnesium_polylepis.1